MENQLIPTNWQLTKLGDISSDISYGYTASATSEPTGMRLLRITDIQNSAVNWQSVPNCKIDPEKIEKYQLKPGDLVFARTGATVGKSYLLQGDIPEAVYASYLIRVRCLEGISIEFLSYYFRSPYYWRQITDFSAGIGQPNVNGTKLKNLSVPLPPLTEQKVIADKLDTLLAQVDNIKARLDRIPEILKRFRQSVLAAAVSGRLTEEWRKKHATYDEWQQVSLGDLVENGPQNGIYKPNNLYGSGCLIIRIDSFYDGLIANWKDLKRVQVEPLEIQKWKVRQGDILINRVNSIEYLGKSALVPELIEPAIFESNIMRLSLVRDLAEPSFISLFLRSPVGLERLKANAKLAVNQASINQNDVKSCLLKLPKLAEQIEIVRRVDQLFAHADRIEQQVNQALARVNSLTQSILAKAFRGELTEQWREDHPELISGENSAEALLERIKAERAAKVPAKRTRKKAIA